MNSSSSEFEARKEQALHLFKQTSLCSGSFAPAVVRLAWHAGIRIPPPHFAGFVPTAVAAGACFGAFFAAFMWLFTWRSGPPSTVAIATGVGVVALLAGLGIAGGYALERRKFGLPLWRDLRPEVGSRKSASTA